MLEHINENIITFKILSKYQNFTRNDIQLNFINKMAMVVNK